LHAQHLSRRFQTDLVIIEVFQIAKASEVSAFSASPDVCCAHPVNIASIMAAAMTATSSLFMVFINFPPDNFLIQTDLVWLCCYSISVGTSTE
jgi:hypothetical protein